MQIVKKRLYAAYLMLPYLFPHLLFYFFSKNRQVIKSDMGGAKTLYIIWFMINLIGMFFIID